MTNESYWRSLRFWWGAYVIFVGQFQTPALLIDGFLLSLLTIGLRSTGEYQKVGLAVLGSWIFFTKIVKLIPHFRRHPEDLKFLPLSIVFSYLHGAINIYACLTLHVTAWGSQNLEQLKTARAENAEVVPLLRDAMDEAETYREPTPGKFVS